MYVWMDGCMHACMYVWSLDIWTRCVFFDFLRIPQELVIAVAAVADPGQLDESEVDGRAITGTPKQGQGRSVGGMGETPQRQVELLFLGALHLQFFTAALITAVSGLHRNYLESGSVRGARVAPVGGLEAT